MTPRERFHATARFQSPDRAFLLRPWTWRETRERWRREGLPAGADLAVYFGSDAEQCAPVACHNGFGVPDLRPPFERKVLSRTGDCEVVQDETGAVIQQFAGDPLRSMPKWIEYPLKDRADWEDKIKPRLNAASPGRAPTGADLDQYADSVRDRDYPLGLWVASFYGWSRSLMGVQRVSYMIYDDPGLVREMCEHFADYRIELLGPLLAKVQFDFAFIWEDMAGKAGPLCSPASYRELMLPALKRVTEFLRRHGIDIIIVDSDGDNDPLVPLWLEAGVTGLRPFEAAAGCDPVRTRRQYPRLIIQGGIDKRALAQDRESIGREVLSKVPWLCLQCGYFPQVDHLVPPDVSLDNYSYYSALLRAVVQDPERHLHEARAKGAWAD